MSEQKIFLKKNAMMEQKRKIMNKPTLTNYDIFDDQDPIKSNDSCVYKGRCKVTGEKVAIKLRNKSTYLFHYNEISKLRAIQSEPGVVKLIESISTPYHFFMITKCPENEIDLFEYVTEKGAGKGIGEDEAKIIFRQVVETLQNLFKKYGIIHGDIKSENIIIDKNTMTATLIDFEASYVDKKTDSFRYYAPKATVFFLPPEWFAKNRIKSQSASTWALGMMLYEMISGNFPFEEGKESLFTEIPISNLNCSDNLKKILSKCLDCNPAKRPTIKNLLKQKWLV